MARSVRFHPAALEDAEEAANWYAERSPRIASRFLDELERLIAAISDAPTRFPVIEGSLRRALFQGFPFSVIRLEETMPVVVAVAHAR